MSIVCTEFSEICYVVQDIERSVKNWAETSGAGPFFRVDAEPENVIYRGKPSKDTIKAALGFSGSTLIEFIELKKTEKQSIWNEVLKGSLEAVHHIYPDMRPLTHDEYDKEIAKYEEAGLKIAWSSVVPPDCRNCFIDATDRIGCFIELLQISEKDWEFMKAMLKAHQTRDRKRPYRNAIELSG